MTRLSLTTTPDSATSPIIDIIVKFRSMMNLYYRDAIGAIVCYDMTEERSFNAVNYWVNEMMQKTDFNEGGFTMALVGNKCDLPMD